MIVAEGHGQGGRPDGSDARPAVVANVPIGLALFASLTSQVGDGLTRLTEQAFTLPDDLQYRRHGLIFGAAPRGQDDPARNHRYGVRAQHPQLCPPVRLPRPAARPHLGGRSAGIDRHLVAGDSDRDAVGRGLARTHVRVRDAAAGRRRRHDRDRARDRHLPGGRGAPQCPVERRDRARRHRVRTAGYSPTPGPRRSPGPSSWPRCRPRTTS